MELTSKNMYEVFKDKIWKELEPLDPNWFEVLIRQASADDGNVSDQDELCANQEGNFKVPSDKTAPNSQPFSTPKAFRHRRVVSPHTQDDSFTTEQEKEALLSTATESPQYLRLSKQGVSEGKYEGNLPQSEIGFELLHTPYKSEVHHAKSISESLGAQINLDISWTSSLNTPPAVPSTLILTKNYASLSPGGISAEGNVVFVRKLFPSLSNVSTADASSKNNEITAVVQGAATPKGDSQTIHQTVDPWQQKLPDAIKDGEIRSAIKSVLDGAENTLSIFFANSSSALRKVKPAKIQRKQIIETKEHNYSCLKSLTSESTPSTKEEHPPSVPVTPPVSKADPRMSQWSPLSLSEIPTCTADMSISTKRSLNDLASEQLVRPHVIATSELLKKRRAFVYNIGALKPHAQSKETPCQKMESSLWCQDSEKEGSDALMGNVPDEKKCNGKKNNEVPSQGCVNQENLPPPAQSKVQDYDMSQLCREFANDFSPIKPFPGKENEALKDNQSTFVPSVCLSAVKQAKQKARQANLQHDMDRVQSIVDNKMIDDDDDCSKNDSGFLSAAVAASSTMTASTVGLPGPSNTCGTPTCLKPNIHWTTPFQSTSKKNVQDDLNVLDEERSHHFKLDSEKCSDFHIKTSTPQQRTISKPQSLPSKTAVSHSNLHTSGFKTASNKGITISLSNLEKAKFLLEETDNKIISTGPPTECDNAMHKTLLKINEPGKHKMCKSNLIFSLKESKNDSCPLTDSQKADVTELCSLLEDADSQFEFTQYKTDKMKQEADNTTSLKADKELESDLLTGIDFNDSFSSDAQKDMTTARLSQERSPAMDITRCDRTDANKKLPAEPKKERPSIGVEKVSQDRGSPMSTKTSCSQRNEETEINEWENKNLMIQRGVPTAQENVLRVSRKCLLEARSLFADLEERPTDMQKTEKESDSKPNLEFNKFNESPKVIRKSHEEQQPTNMTYSDSCDKQVSNLQSEHATKYLVKSPIPNGFQMASGKNISVLAKHLEQANDLFKDFEIIKRDCSTSENQINCNKSAAKSNCHRKKLSKLKNVMSKKSIADETVQYQSYNIDKRNCSISNVTPSSSKAFSLHGNLLTISPSLPLDTTPKCIESSAIEHLSKSDGVGSEGATMSNNGKKEFCRLKEDRTTMNTEMYEEIPPPLLAPTTKMGEIPKVSGKGVFTFFPALMKAKSSDKSDMDNKMNHPSQAHVSVHDPSPNIGGFVAASGKPVTLSSEALQKAKALFDNICLDSPATSNTKRKDDKQEHFSNVNLGYSTAAGKRVHMSQKNLIKSKSFFNGFDVVGSPEAMTEMEDFIKEQNIPSELCSTVCNKEKETPKFKPLQKVNISPVETEKQCPQNANGIKWEHLNILPRQNCGFQTASGKGVTISSEALKKAKNLMSECERFNDAISESPNPNPVSGSSFHTSKFLRDQNVTVSSEALEMTKALSDFSTYGDISTPLNTIKYSQSHNRNKVTISSDELKKKTLLSESEETVLLGPSCNTTGLPTANDSKVTLSSETLQKHTTVFREVNLETAVSTDMRECDKKQAHPGDLKKVDFGFTNAKGEKISVSHKGLLKARWLMKEFDESVSTHLSKKEEFGQHHVAPVKDGINTELLIGVCDEKEILPDDKPDLNQSKSKERNNDTISMVKENPSSLSSQKCGFQTAGGKGVTISLKALEKAKSLLSKTEWLDDNIGVNAPHNFTVTPSCRPGSSTGFLAASDKQLAVSSKALHKAKALFSDINLSADSLISLGTRLGDVKHEVQQKEMKKNNDHCGFTTAGGAKVHVSEGSLLRARRLLRDDAEPDIYSHGLTHKDQSTEKNGNDCSLPNTNAKDMSVIDCDSLVKSVVTLQKVCSASNKSESCTNKIDKSKVSNSIILEENTSQAGCTHDIHIEKMSLDCGGIRVSCQKKSKVIQADEPSLDKVSLNLLGCTATQQNLLVQEALDCTEALLHDEGLTGHSLSLTESKSLYYNLKSKDRSYTDYQRKGKRRIEDQFIPGQPPLKRRLLDEFEKTAVGQNTMLDPVRSCPNALTKDRGNFIYSNSLQPHITRPYRNAKVYLDAKSQNTTSSQYLTPVNDKSMGSKTPVFVPPFVRNLKPKMPGSAMTKKSTQTSAFVPPFKKQRAMVPETSLQLQEKDDKCSKPNSKPSTSTFKPPTEKVANVTSLSDNTRDTVIKNQSPTVEWDPACSGAKPPSVDDPLFRIQGLQNDIELAQDMQDMRIRKKKRQTIRPLPGTLFLTKGSGVERVPLKVAVNRIPPAKYTSKQLYSYGVSKDVCEISSETAESFRFSLLQYFKEEVLADSGGVQLGDGGWLIPSIDGTAGKTEFYRALCDTPGVDPKLISEAWVYNHYRWIVWKQASMERSFPQVLGSLCLTPEQVLLQLKYRYDVEVDHSRRPSLRKITEKDDTAAKTLVLCVCGIVSDGLSPTNQIHNDAATPQGADPKYPTPAAVIWLTDGWYAIKAQLDKPLTAMLHRGRLAVGGKLLVHGAQLVGSQDACPPLEAPESLMLKIGANSSRPARWDVKLGFYKDPRPFLLPVSCLYSDGGTVGCVDIIILRSYPIQWMERKPDGVVFRSIRAEEKEARQYYTRKQIAMEALCAKLQMEFEKEEKGKVKALRKRQTLNHQNISSLQDGEELHEAVGDDPTHLEAHLSEQQLDILQSFRRSLMDKKQAELQDRYRRALETEGNEVSFPKRDVTTVWRLCFTDTLEQSSRVYQLNLWRASSDLQSLLKEGSRYKVYNLSTTEGKKRSCVESLQFTGTKKTQFEEMQVSQEWFTTCFQQRVSTSLVTIQNPDFQPLCGEVDLTGFVVSVDGLGSSSAFFLCDGKFNFVKVRCFSSLAQSGLEDVVKPGVLLALSNLQLKGQSMYPTPVLYAGDLTVFSTNPKEPHLKESLTELSNLIQSQENFFLTANETLSHLMNVDGQSSIYSPALQPQTPSSTTEGGLDTKTQVSCQKPNRGLGSFTPMNRNPPATTASTEKDPKSLKRKRALDYLSRIPSPPPLSNLGSVVSPYVKKIFNPPRKSGTPSTLTHVQTAAPKPPELQQRELVNDEELAMIDTQALHID